jgi:heme/copper-type cytochrome/quinol oxidase subunit 4
MWFGLAIMLALVVGIVWWMVWAMKKDKEKS